MSNFPPQAPTDDDAKSTVLPIYPPPRSQERPRAAPFILGWIPIHLTIGWLGHGAIIFGAFDIVVGLVGVTLFRRDMLVLYLQQ